MRAAGGRRTAGLIAAAALALLAGCGKGGDEHKRPDPTVGYVVVQPAAVPVQTQLGGRTVAFATSEVRPQVSGVIRARLFAEGGTVRQGEPLFQIDSSLYRAAVNQASANLEAARAGAEAATVKAERFRPLADMEAISRQQYTDALAQARQARAAVAQTGAALETARINLRYTTVPAPISGRIGRSLFTTGALVNANQADALAVIQQVDPIYVDVQQSSAELLALKRALAGGGVSAGSATVHLALEDGSEYPLAGIVQFSEMMVNEATGTITLRARFPNPEGLLLPGMFVQARFDQAVNPAAYILPDSALMRDIGGDAFVFVVAKGNKAERRKVTADRTLNADWVVTAGLNPGDRVIVQGVAALKHGMTVKPVPASSPERLKPPTSAGGAGAAGAAGRG
ncbi:efflux RND transporter periplasmic adaptor subunit [Novosphingobium bradum]|uniref:Efflux RND transporter periplasmic adaptor subunit n=1 Tax=Novosphingobium bradum TaxID=1737444 RepID=A0ABV7IRQ7_9SPHN